jgi:hypothetical protein
MQFTKHIFRPPSNRPYQFAIRQKYVVGTVFVAPPVVGTTYVRFKLPTAYPFRINHQRRSNVPVYGPRLASNGWMDVIRERTERYGKLHKREVFDVREVLREVYGTPEIPPADVGSIHILRTPTRELFPRFKEARRKELPLGKAAALLGADIGWLISFIIKRGYGHNLRR